MSMSFDNPVNADAMKKIREAFGEAAASDEKTFLFDKMPAIDSRVMKEIANTAKQPATIGLHGEGEIVTMSDGTKYRATPQGWQKVKQ